MQYFGLGAVSPGLSFLNLGLFVVLVDMKIRVTIWQATRLFVRRH